MMRRTIVAALCVLAFSAVANAQFRGEEPRRPSVAEGVYSGQQNNNILGFFNPDNLEMRHSVSFSYGMVGEQGLGVSMYTNSLRYKIAEPLSVRADISMLFSPFGSATSLFKQDLSGIYLRRASIDYKASEDMHISLQFRNEPYYNPYYGSYGRYGMMGSGLFGYDDGDNW